MFARWLFHVVKIGKSPRHSQHAIIATHRYSASFESVVKVARHG